MSEACGIGVFGKLPALGDFLSRGLPADSADAVHAWLACGLAHARDRLGPRFDPAYMQAPVWRFVLPPGTCGAAGAAGVLMPSVDAVGRAFPLVLAAPLADEPDAIACLGPLSGWFDELETMARAVLEEGFVLEPWLASLSTAMPPAGLVAEPASDFRWLSGAGEQLGAAATPELVRAGAGRVALFWSTGSPFVPPGLVLGRGLPKGDRFVLLLLQEGMAAADRAPAAAKEPS